MEAEITKGPAALSSALLSGVNLDPYPGGTDSLDNEDPKGDGDGDKVDVGFDTPAGMQTVPPGDYQTDTVYPLPESQELNSAVNMAPFRDVVGGTLEDGTYSGSPGSGNYDGTPPRHYNFRIDDMTSSSIGEGLGKLPDDYRDPHPGGDV
jgi:hypothetical protein